AKRINPSPPPPLSQQEILTIVKGCAAEASILDRLSSFVSIYFILVGILSGIGRTFGPCVWEDWPLIPPALAWTLPAVFKRFYGGIIVVHDPKNKLDGDRIEVED